MDFKSPKGTVHDPHRLQRTHSARTGHETDQAMGRVGYISYNLVRPALPTLKPTLSFYYLVSCSLTALPGTSRAQHEQ